MVLVRGQLRRLRGEQGGTARCRSRQAAPGDPPEADTRLVSGLPAPRDDAAGTAAEEWGHRVTPRDDAAGTAAEEWGHRVTPRDDAAGTAAEEWGHRATPRDDAARTNAEEWGDRT